MLRDARSADPLLDRYHGAAAAPDDAVDMADRGRRSYRGASRRPSPRRPTTASSTIAHSPSSLHARAPSSSAVAAAAAAAAAAAGEEPPSRRPLSQPNYHHHLPLHHHPHPHRPVLSRYSTGGGLRSRSPALAVSAAARHEARKKYTYAAVFMAVCLVSFTVQTELSAYIQHDLGWNKAYCMLYLTHSSWALLWPLQLAVLWLARPRPRETSWRRFWDAHVRLLRATAAAVERRDHAHAPSRPGSAAGAAGYGYGGYGGYGYSPWPYLLRTTSYITTALTIAGLSWYLAVSMTTPSDLTAIYNCSAFFAYAFSVPLLKEKLRADKMLAVAVAIVGVLVVAYGDGGSSSSSSLSSSSSAAAEEGAPGAGSGPGLDPATRFLGNLIIGAGSVLYGLYEVLYKRFACPPDGTDATRGVIFANAFGSLMGLFTLLVLWVPLPVLHVLGWETFEVPTGRTAWLLLVSVFMNMTFSGSFLVLISLTSPVLSSVAALLTIFMVAIVDWWWTGTPLTGAAVLGGLLIIVAFVMLSWSTWREMNEEEHRKQIDLSGDEDD